MAVLSSHPLTSVVLWRPQIRQQGLVQCKLGTTLGSRSCIKTSKEEERRISIDEAGCWSLLPSSLLAAVPMLLYPEAALAVDGQLGILEGRSFALVHPIVMGSLFLYTLWAGYLGWQWRQTRTIQVEINELKKQVKPREEGAPPSETEQNIEKLTQTRKDLIKGGFRDRHFNAGSILLAFGVTEAVGGAVNTWFRTGKLFPGPHLFAGAGITVLWALAAGLVPAMQKGNETARNLHIALNALNVILFVWQIPTGWEIVLKVLEFAPLP